MLKKFIRNVITPKSDSSLGCRGVCFPWKRWKVLGKSGNNIFQAIKITGYSVPLTLAFKPKSPPAAELGPPFTARRFQ